MRMLSSIRTIAAWEMKRSMTTVGRHVLPLAAGLLLLLILATALAAQGGIHMQDGMYCIGIDDPDVARIVAPDSRFIVTVADGPALLEDRDRYDIVILQKEISVSDTERGQAALKAFERVYKHTSPRCRRRAGSLRRIPALG